MTAIVIPIICIYFFWVTKKELRESHEKWLQLKNVPEEAIISGTIMQLSGNKQRFSYNRFVYVLEMKVQSDYSFVNIKKVIPIEHEVEIPQIKTGETIRAFGNWKQDYFLVNRIEKKF
ncbi:hypothetical protein [Cytobacillus depressus]|uniref:hypothetical protein n=1 Tax=Cytobacillus depressus TaxID=1602942 RepID=UPI001FE5E183|nr:hypothetical protein [Cytobacillus depressus]